MKYRKKPVEIEAIQWNGENINEIRGFALNNCSFNMLQYSNTDIPIYTLVIHTLEGDMVAKPGDFIIKGVQGEFYPCKPDIFEQTYEAVE